LTAEAYSRGMRFKAKHVAETWRHRPKPSREEWPNDLRTAPRRAAAISDTAGTPTCTHRLFKRVFRAQSMARPACFGRQGSSTARERYSGRRPDRKSTRLNSSHV